MEPKFVWYRDWLPGCEPESQKEAGRNRRDSAVVESRQGKGKAMYPKPAMKENPAEL